MIAATNMATARVTVAPITPPRTGDRVFLNSAVRGVVELEAVVLVLLEVVVVAQIASQKRLIDWQALHQSPTPSRAKPPIPA